MGHGNPAQWNAKQMVEIAEKEANKYIQSKLTYSQIRKIFAQIIKIRTQLETNKEENINKAVSELVLLKPLLAYAVGKSMGRNGSPVQKFQVFMFDCIDEISNLSAVDEQRKAINNFIKVIEAIVAYHRFKGGRES